MTHNTRHTLLCRAVRQLLTSWGCVVIPVKNGPTPYTRRDGSTGYRRGAIRVGAADLVACMPSGRFLTVEVKTGRGKPSKPQQRFLADVAQAGGLAMVVYDSVAELIDRKDEICFGMV